MKRLGIAFVLMALALAVTAGFASKQGSATDPAAPARIVSVTGEDLRADGFRGVTEFFFGARWCPPCVRELSDLRRRAGRMPRSGYRVVLVGAAERETEAELIEWARESGFRGAVVHDADGSVAAALGARALPWYAVIDGEGRVLHSSDSAPEAEQMRRWTTP